MERYRADADDSSPSTEHTRYRGTDDGLGRRSCLKLAGGTLATLGIASGAASGRDDSESGHDLETASDHTAISFDGNWEQWFTNTEGTNTSVTSDSDRSDAVLRVDWPTGEYYGATMEYLMDENHGYQPDSGHVRGATMEYLMDENHGYQPDSGHVRYWVYFPDDWEFHSDGLGGTKLPGFAGTYQTGDHDIGPGGYGGRPSDGTNGWSSRLFNCRPDRADGNGPIGLGSQVYHAGNGGEHGAHPTWDAALERGTWHQIDQYVEMNTPGREDGVYRGWVDGDLAVEMERLYFRDEGVEMNTPGREDGVYRGWVDGDLAVEMERLYFRDEGYGDLIGIQALWCNCYFGGDWGSPVDQHMLFDDLELWLWEERP
ncbi:polysaccharide lyase [Natronorubrum tibetense]|uniref:Polysaccharide lyase 14 domain-containing protein n=1 Tax=Natronorubrum tibetense GA33 TaxID=1114856 RepID=L9WBW1_9EURY|nr:hypothetical protein [Natronorubrum tibetense]ELY45803.1 hypothetical protein C496_02637 [Natronorubrum tibetense GA33]